MPLRSLALRSLIAAVPCLIAHSALASEDGLLVDPVQLTDSSQFSRAGESYFSPDGDWIIFQAVPVAEETGGQPVYGMYVAPLERDAYGTVTGMGEATRLSEPGAATTCGWFHPTLPGVVLYGSTIVTPERESDAGYSRGTSRYTWDFPTEMEIVSQTISRIVERDVNDPSMRSMLLSRPDVDTPVPLWEREGYDAEGSWSPDGRFVLHTQVNPETKDADIFVRDLAGGVTYPLVTEAGYDGGPFFSPDGTWICYRSDRKGDNLLQLFVAELDFDRRGVPTGIKREVRLTDNGHVNWAPFFHPTRPTLVYATSQVSHMNYEVFSIPFDPTGRDTTPHRVTFADGFDGLPVFSPDGTEMMWTGQRGEPNQAGRRLSQLYLAKIGGDFPLDDARGSLLVDADASPVADAFAAVSPSARRFQQHVATLASEWLEGRLPGTRGIEITEEYIADHFEAFGLEPLFDSSYFGEFRLAMHGTSDVLTCQNVGAVLPGSGDLADRYIVVGAHHDHLGDGSFGSIRGAGEIHEGADDNASGTAAVLLLAEQLAAIEDSGGDRRSVIFVTFSAEEMGLNGAREFARNSPVDLDKIDLMVNFDMIGRITGGRVSVTGEGTAAPLAKILDTAAASSELELVRGGGLTSRSDHAAFYDEEIPCLFFAITPFHDDYHTPDDEFWKLNVHGASHAVKVAQQVVMDAAYWPEAFEFQELANYDRGPSGTMSKIKVRFGIMPGNYNDAEPGIVVQRVSPGGSAEAAGIIDDDRLMAWDGRPITNVTQWMEYMSAHEPGDIVQVTVRRDGQIVQIPVELKASGR
ncbi:MAG: M28 family peptidase [Planctomycetota bacterium]